MTIKNHRKEDAGGLGETIKTTTRRREKKKRTKEKREVWGVRNVHYFNSSPSEIGGQDEDFRVPEGMSKKKTTCRIKKKDGCRNRSEGGERKGGQISTILVFAR